MTSLAATYSLTKSFSVKKNDEKSDLYLNKEEWWGAVVNQRRYLHVFHVFI